MDKNLDYNGFNTTMGNNFNTTQMNGTRANDSYYPPYMEDYDVLNPMVQYEQAYMYYRYLTQQLDYKIKCKQYEEMCKNDPENRNRQKCG